MQTLKETIDKVQDFHQTFGLEFHNVPNAHIDTKIIELRHRLMQEENDEYLEAAAEGHAWTLSSRVSSSHSARRDYRVQAHRPRLTNEKSCGRPGSWVRHQRNV